ncbi:hypothetical protein [Anatilimnocola floriformis]|uniref:hypothetical protein n=1 Tax=Anatilimnocola floriformis TaxID=2948575 RepID=UPI0020C31203|nr:hypothetical protein [Anatilimnocola floriformis]
MKRFLFSAAAIGLSSWLSNSLLAQEELPREPVPAAAADKAPRLGDEAEPLTRGPVHEAFAQAVTPAAENGLTIKKEPPAAIDEIPPAQRPSGDDVAWIPGYWGWDDDRQDFIWISGIWRAMPPGREWVPGYWAKVTDGYQWVSGYWADLRTEEVEYLPAPPDTVDAGPSSPAPTGNEIWIPGTWVWQQNKYSWRAGYWSQGNSRWLWTNAHYVYTPRGYLYVSGYWDFLPPQRGVLFTPVYFRNVPGNYVYTPRMIVNSAGLLDNLFLRPNYRHYYYGDYYASSYRGHGILPYFAFNDSRHGFDSIYSFYRWQNRNDRNWDRQVQDRYHDLRDNEKGRPPRDFAAWRDYRDGNGKTNNNPFLVNSLQDYSKLKGHDLKFRDIDDKTRQSAGQQLKDLDSYRQNRMKQEAEKVARGDDNRGGDRVRLLKPPIGDDQPNDKASDKPADKANDKPTREERTGRDDRPNREDRPATPRAENKGPAGARESDGTVPPREAPKDSRDRPGPLNDIRDKKDPKDAADRPKPDRDRTGPLNDLRDQPKDAPRGSATGDRPKAEAPRPREVPKATPAPRDIPNAAPPRDVPKAAPPREAPKSVAPPREAPKTAPPREAPRANPQPPRAEAPRGNPGGGNPGGGNPGGGGGKGKRD